MFVAILGFFIINRVFPPFIVNLFRALLPRTKGIELCIVNSLWVQIFVLDPHHQAVHYHFRECAPDANGSILLSKSEFLCECL